MVPASPRDFWCPPPRPLLPLGGCVLTFWPRAPLSLAATLLPGVQGPPLLSAGWAPLGYSLGSLPQGPAVVSATLTRTLEAFSLQAGLRVLALIRMD